MKVDSLRPALYAGYILIIVCALSGGMFRAGTAYEVAQAYDASSTNFFVRQNVIPIGATTAIYNGDITTSLRVYYPFDAAYVSGSTLLDASGNSLNGTISGSPTLGTGQREEALTFATGQYVLTSSVPVNTGDKMTISFWFKGAGRQGGTGIDNEILDSSPSQVFFNYYPSSGDPCYSADTGFGTAVHGNVGFNYSCYTPRPADNTWHFFLAEYDISQAVNEEQVYLDNVHLNPFTTGTTNNTGNFSAMQFYLMTADAITAFTHGSLDDLRVYNRLLSIGDINLLYTQGVQGTYSFATSTSFKLAASGGGVALGTSSSASFGIQAGNERNLYHGPAPTYTQIHYHFRNDDGSETTATSMTSGVQDTDITNVAKLATVRLRLEVANKGGTIRGYSAQQFRIEYGLKSTTCAAISSWTDVGAAAGDWDMINSSNITEGANTTNIAVSTGGVADENHTFIVSNAGVKDTSSTVSALSVSSDSFAELEYALQPLTAATTGGVYCFRITNAGSTTNFSYSAYPQATISSAVGSLTFLTDSGTEAFPNVTPGTLSATSTLLYVTTNNSTGFKASIQRSDSVGTMSLSGTYIPDKTPDWIAPASTATVGNATASTTQPLTLQFRVRQTGTDVPDYASAWWGSADTTASALFGGVSSTTQTIVNRSTSALSTTTMTVLYNLNVPATQKTGTYSGSVTYTVTANP